MVWNKERVSFIVVDDKVVFLHPRDRSTSECLQTLGVDSKLIDGCTRGYISQDTIRVFSGTGYAKVTMPSDAIMDDIRQCAWDCFGPGEYTVGNGCYVGIDGVKWEPIEVVRTITCG